MTDDRPRPLAFIGLAFVLGIIGFGGGYAIAQRVRHEVVDERGWMTDEAFVEALAVTSSLPGTTSANLLTFLGHRFGGFAGALGATVAFLAPSIVAMVVLAATYERMRGLGSVASLLDGMAVATTGIVAAVAVDLWRRTVKDRAGTAIMLAAAALLATRALNLLETVAIAGIVGALLLRPKHHVQEKPREPPPTSLRSIVFAGLPALATAGPLLALFLVFARIGIATVGGGVAMIAPIEHEVVHVHGWLSERAFDDAIVFGQITPGPVGISSTFIGWRIAGPEGAAAATLGMFGPPFVLTALAAESLPRIQRSLTFRGFLAGVAPAIIGAIIAAAIALTRTAVHTPVQGIVAIATFALLVVRPKLSPLVPLAAGALVELAMARLS